ncbi:MAG: 3-deoxy-7-phosphoheptulonate synthase [Clostridium sp.]|uniref:3-deoxy-7-phosphoheptulonate synthase n=1 Tax=Clostridium sp. TaxID=1506 RepID=UPI00306C613B
MIVILKAKIKLVDIERVNNKLINLGMKTQIIEGTSCVSIGIIGYTNQVDLGIIEIDNCVECVMRVEEPFKRANRKFHPEDTVINVGGITIGGKKLAIIAGPCSVESEEQIISIAESVKVSGTTFLRGGAYKPRTSPYVFQGLKEAGIELLKVAREKTGLSIVTEIMSTDDIDRFVEDVDIIQVGARNMQNFALLKELGKINKPVLLKRGLSSTIEEWLMSAEYIMAGGNENVILCERGIRTFESFTRNTLDLSAVPAVKRLSHLPVIIDPSHAAGMWWMVESLAKAAVAVGADGLMIEVHNDPQNAKCDGAQSLTPKRFDNLMNELKEIATVVGREL